MWSIFWRIGLMICFMPFMLFPLIGWPLIPIQIYLVISIAARVWKRVNDPGAPDNEPDSRTPGKLIS